MIYVPPARFVSSSQVFVTPYMEGVRSVPAPLKGTESEGEGTVPQIPTRGIPVQGLTNDTTTQVYLYSFWRRVASKHFPVGFLHE